MNRVHEQCPKIDSETVLSQTGSKQPECTECTSCWPSSTPKPPSRSCPKHLLLAPVRPLHPARLPLRPVPRANAPVALPALLPWAPAAPLRRATPAVSRHSYLPCDTGSPASCSWTSQYSLYCNTNLPHSLTASITIQSSVLRYTQPAKPPSLQYKPVYCNTILAIPALLKPPSCNTI